VHIENKSLVMAADPAGRVREPKESAMMGQQGMPATPSEDLEPSCIVPFGWPN
jgi:hypothetical protein